MLYIDKVEVLTTIDLLTTIETFVVVIDAIRHLPRFSIEIELGYIAKTCKSLPFNIFQQPSQISVWTRLEVQFTAKSEFSDALLTIVLFSS